MKFECRYCKLIFECLSWEDAAEIQSQQCWVTVRGVTHSLRGRVN